MDVNDDDDKRSFKYSFRLNEEQNMHFCRMMEEAGMSGNRSRFIVRRIFGEEFRHRENRPDDGPVYHAAEQVLRAISTHR